MNRADFSEVQEDPAGSPFHALFALKILVVDDDPIQVLVLTRSLTVAGFTNVVAASNAKSASEKLTEFRPALVITDYHMAGFTGLDLLRRIRQDAELAHTLVFVLTADHTEECRKAFVAAGASDFAVKPLVGPLLLDRVFRLLQAVPLPPA